jgi:hypothetical protein
LIGRDHLVEAGFYRDQVLFVALSRYRKIIMGMVEKGGQQFFPVGSQAGQGFDVLSFDVELDD